MTRTKLFFLAAATVALGVTGCGCGDDGPTGERTDAGPRMFDDAGQFFCGTAESEGCGRRPDDVNIHYTCEREGEFLQPVTEDCAAMGKICVTDLWCVVCRPGEVGCQDNDAVVCRDDGSGWDVIDECDLAAGFACRDGSCQNLCDIALEERSYKGCEFYSVDLDNASIAVGRDASAQQYAVVVSNPGQLPTEVSVEVNDAPFGSEPELRELERVVVNPGDLEVLELPRREVDGSSSNTMCLPATRLCPGSETCICSRMDAEPPCFCRVSATSSGMNDGTHTAVTSNAFRIRSQLPIIAYQFNPLDNVGVFSNDASLLLPTSAIDTRYTVAGWPQTIANNDVDPDRDFDPSSTDEDLRATLSIVGTQPGTILSIRLGNDVGRIVGAGPIPMGRPGELIELTIGPFDVVNLETQGLNADFTGTLVDASHPVTVFVGSEASDVPRFETYATRQCCADHLEEQLFPDSALGARFIVARMPPRSVALNRAFVSGDSVAEPNEPEWVKVVAISSGATTVTTTLPPPDDRFTLGEREGIILRADQDFIIDADRPVSVLQALPSQEAVGIPSEYPGGDPAIIAVPPTEQYRQDYVFLTPDLYAFDFVTISGPRMANIRLDGAPLDPLACTTSPADGIVRRPGDPPPNEVIHRCQFSFPAVIGLPNVQVDDGVQNDGVHTIVADQPVGIVVYGFDAFVSYAYAGGLNLDIIN